MGGDTHPDLVRGRVLGPDEVALVGDRGLEPLVRRLDVNAGRDRVVELAREQVLALDTDGQPRLGHPIGLGIPVPRLQERPRPDHLHVGPERQPARPVAVVPAEPRIAPDPDPQIDQEELLADRREPGDVVTTIDRHAETELDVHVVEEVEAHPEDSGPVARTLEQRRCDDPRMHTESDVRIGPAVAVGLRHVPRLERLHGLRPVQQKPRVTARGLRVLRVSACAGHCGPQHQSHQN